MDRPRVKVAQGVLEGVSSQTIRGKSYFSFKGIPYAEPPIGTLRFKNPVRSKGWQGIRDASKEGNIAKQKDFFTETHVITGDEDCLFLNVHTPHLPSKDTSLLPVMVIIHGGGFVFGSGNQSEFGPDYIIEQDTIFVSFNYRLNVFGFLCLETPEAPGNMGLMDQNLALKWVQENIKAFNGSPDNVTIFGISAGGVSVEYHMLSPKSRGLFHKAIIQSGSTLNFWGNTHNRKLVTRGYDLGNYLGGNYENPQDLCNFLRNVDSDTLVDATWSIFKFEYTKENGELFTFSPTTCSVPNHENFLEEDPKTLLSTGNFARVPTISGHCLKEGISMDIVYNQDIEHLRNGHFIEYIPKCVKITTEEFDRKIREVYSPSPDDLNEYDYVIDFLSDISFIGGMNASMMYRMKYTSENYLYCFKYDGKMNFFKTFHKVTSFGAGHSDEQTYLGTNSEVTEENATANDIVTRERMVQMWTDFAKTSNPTPSLRNKVDTKWLPATEQNLYTMFIDNELTLKINQESMKRRELWLEFYNNI